MPAVSRQQQKWAFAVKGDAWARKHHFDNPGKNLPEHVAKKRARNAKAARRRIAKKRKHAQ